MEVKWGVKRTLHKRALMVAYCPFASCKCGSSLPPSLPGYPMLSWSSCQGPNSPLPPSELASPIIPAVYSHHPISSPCPIPFPLPLFPVCLWFCSMSHSLYLLTSLCVAWSPVLYIPSDTRCIVVVHSIRLPWKLYSADGIQKGLLLDLAHHRLVIPKSQFSFLRGP